MAATKWEPIAAWETDGNDSPGATMSAGQQRRVRLVVVRHGQAGRKSQWRDDDALRPLDAKGTRQAEDLVKLLRRAPVSRIVSSPYVRCVQTVEPLALHQGIRLETTDVLAPDAGAQAITFVDELMGAAPRAVVICTHREVLTELLPGLARRFDVRLGHRLPGAKGSQWILDFSAKRNLTSVKYRAPRP
jgi:8-oxo-dGTP diphosphatase